MREERNVNAATGKWAATDRKTNKKKKIFCARFEQRTRFCIFAFSPLHNFLGPMENRNRIEVGIAIEHEILTNFLDKEPRSHGSISQNAVAWPRHEALT